MSFHYHDAAKCGQLYQRIQEYLLLKAEQGADVQRYARGLEQALNGLLEQAKALEVDSALLAREPDDLDSIIRLSNWREKPLWSSFDRAKYLEKVKGAMLARFAGCTLGAPIELWPNEETERFFETVGDAYPPVDYLSRVRSPQEKRYEFSTRADFERERIDGVPCDDDITYTLLGLLLAERYGLDLTTEQIGEGWKELLPFACTAEDVALRNLNNGVQAKKAAELDNPYAEWIGADIRSDPWGYVAPGNPALAARLAYADAFLTHRRNGIYGAMLVSAAIAAAFAVGTAREVWETGLCYIPQESSAAKAARWALEISDQVTDYRAARAAVAEQFKGMSGVHTLNNLCLTIWGTLIGEGNVTKTLSQTVAMGLDNDCTTATAGSVAGALCGLSGVEEHWTRRFHNKVYTYLNGHRQFQIDEVAERFAALAGQGYCKQQ